MKNHIKTTMALAAMFMSAASLSRACDCKEILEDGIADITTFKTASEYREKLKWAILSIKDKESRLAAESSGSIGIFGVLDLGGSLEADSVKRLREQFQSNGELAINSSEYIEVTQKLVNKDIVAAWLECKKVCAASRGIVDGKYGDLFARSLVTLQYFPIAETDADVTIKGLILSGFREEAGSSLVKGATLKKFHGLTLALLRLDPHSPATVVIETEGRGSIVIDYPVKPPIIHPEEVEITKSINAIGRWPNTRGDNDMDTDKDDVAPVYISTEILRDGQKVILKAKFRCEEDGGDHTRFSGTRIFTLYTIPETHDLLEIKAAGGLSKSFTQSFKGKSRGHLKIKGIAGSFWDSLRCRIDSKGRDDDIVGFTGDMRLTVIIQKKQ